MNYQSRSRLDRVLVSEGWDNHFYGVVKCLLLRLIFDHHPIMLDGGGLRRSPTLFRFENMLLGVEGFKDLLRNRWMGI